MRKSCYIRSGYNFGSSFDDIFCLDLSSSKAYMVHSDIAPAFTCFVTMFKLIMNHTKDSLKNFEDQTGDIGSVFPFDSSCNLLEIPKIRASERPNGV